MKSSLWMSGENFMVNIQQCFRYFSLTQSGGLTNTLTNTQTIIAIPRVTAWLKMYSFFWLWLHKPVWDMNWNIISGVFFVVIYVDVRSVYFGICVNDLCPVYTFVSICLGHHYRPDSLSKSHITADEHEHSHRHAASLVTCLERSHTWLRKTYSWFTL